MSTSQSAMTAATRHVSHNDGMSCCENVTQCHWPSRQDGERRKLSLKGGSEWIGSAIASFIQYRVIPARSLLSYYLVVQSWAKKMPTILVALPPPQPHTQQTNNRS